jgi:hypothetical protein
MKAIEVQFEYADFNLTLSVFRTGTYGEYEYDIKVLKIEMVNGSQPEIYQFITELKKYQAKIEAEAIEHYEEAMSNQESGFEDDDSE